MGKLTNTQNILKNKCEIRVVSGKGNLDAISSCHGDES